MCKEEGLVVDHWECATEKHYIDDGFDDRVFSPFFSPRERALLGYQLIKSGRKEAGLRELSVAIELSGFQNRPYYMNLLGDAYEFCGYHLWAQLCFKEAIEVENKWRENPDAEFINRVFKKINIKPLEKSEVPCYLSIIEQGYAFEDFKELSYGNILLESYTHMENIMYHLGAWKHGTSKDIIIKSIFSFIVNIPPVHCLNDFIQSQGLLKKFKNIVESELSLLPEIELNIEACFWMKSIQKTYRNPQKFYMIALALSCIMAYTAFLEKDYNLAFLRFRWCLQLYESIGVTVVEAKHPLSLRSKRSIAVYCALAYASHYSENDFFSNKKFHLDNLSGVLVSIVDGYEIDMNPGDCWDYHELDQIMIVLSVLYEKIAILNGKTLSFPKGDSPPERVFSMCRSDVENMIKKLILSAAMKLPDDFTITSTYDRLIFGLLMYGGLNVKTIKFFKFLRDYFRIQCETFGSIVETKPIMPMQFKDYSFTSSYTAILNNICKASEEQKKMPDDRHEMINLLCPNIYISHDSHELILMDRYAEESTEMRVTESSYLKYSLKRLIRGRGFRSAKKLSNSHAMELLNKSKEFEVFWKDCYLIYHKKIPAQIIDYCNSNF